ncbi:MAG: S8 family serine peptidase [Candidatus Paceibacteria bacterium]
MSLKHKAVLCLCLFFGTFFFSAHTSAKTPNDPQLSPVPWQYEKIGLPQAWDKTTGSEAVTVAVIDNGFDHFHPDLIDNVWKNKDEIANNGIDDDGNGYIDDVWGWSFVSEDYDNDGEISPKEEKGNKSPRPNIFDLKDVSEKTVHHGTAVAGLIGAQGDNGLAGSGVNWDVNLMNIKIANNAGSGKVGSFPKAVRYAINNGADIISFSLVGSMSGEDVEDLKDVIDYAHKKDVAMFAAAGNKAKDLSKDPMYPVCADSHLEESERIIGVSAVRRSRLVTRFTNTGSECIDITAPGVNLSSTVRYAPSFGLEEKYRGSWSGTSFAVPLVSGTAGLIKSIQPDWGPEKIYQAMFETVSNSDGHETETYKDLFGAGLLQADEAVEYAWERATADRDLPGLIGIGSRGRAYTSRFRDSESPIELPFYNPQEEKKINQIARGESRIVTLVGAGKDREINLYASSTGWINVGEIDPGLKPDDKISDLVVGDINHDDREEVILSYSGPDNKTRVKLFQQSSGLAVEKSFSREIQSLDILNSLKQDELIGLFKSDEDYYVSFLNQRLVESKRVNIDFKAQKLDSGDIDGDKRIELVLSSYENNPPLLSYLERDGTIKRRFYSYDPSYTGRYKTVVGDINSDEKDEIITVPKFGHELRAWNDGADIIRKSESYGLDLFTLPILK